MSLYDKIRNQRINIISVFGSIFNLRGEDIGAFIEIDRDSEEVNREALASDWEMVFKDFDDAFRSLGNKISSFTYGEA